MDSVLGVVLLINVVDDYNDVWGNCNEIMVILDEFHSTSVFNNLGKCNSWRKKYDENVIFEKNLFI